MLGRVRLNELESQIKRLVNVSSERLIGALCMEWSEEWITGRRYLDMTDLK